MRIISFPLLIALGFTVGWALADTFDWLGVALAMPTGLLLGFGHRYLYEGYL